MQECKSAEEAYESAKEGESAKCVVNSVKVV